MSNVIRLDQINIEKPIPSEIAELNQKHAVVQYGGQTLVMNIEKNEHDQQVVTFSKTGDFEKRYCNKFFGSGRNAIKLGRAWLEHEDRRQYDGAVFNPNGVPANFYNFWQGLAVKPTQGDCSLYLDHIRKVIASGEEKLADYILDFMADAIQNPGIRPGVALVLRGDQGVGKGVFVKYFAKLFGSHFAHVTNTNHFLGNFNGLLENKLLLFADEAFWAGDKDGEGLIKALVTEDTIQIERKYMDVKSQKNFIRLIVASNNDWVVPAMANERRFCVIDVSDARRQDTSYFAAVAGQMENGGLEALMHFLLNRDISGKDLRKFPQTSALNDQKIHSLNPLETWWYDCLYRGYVAEPIYGCASGWEDTVSTEDVFRSLTKGAQSRGIKYRGSRSQLGKELKRLVPQVRKVRVTNPLYGAALEETKPGFRERQRQYEFPSLQDCREHFDKLFNMQTNWPKEK